MPIEQDLQAVEGIVAAAKHRLRKVPHLTVQTDLGRAPGRTPHPPGPSADLYHKQLVQEAVAGLSGVKQVVNDIEVVW